MNRIYTRTGDGGTTGIHGGARVPKDDPRIEANGTLDELNCQIGIVRSMLRCPVKPGMTEEVKPGMTESERSDGRYLSSEHFSASETNTGGAERASYDDILHAIQKNLMTVMSQVATPAAERSKNPNPLPENLVANCEATMDALTAEAGPSRHFILPGGTPLAARLQLARAVCRRAERRLWTLHRQDPIPEAILQYINRLSDLLFVLARCELARQDWPEERWQAFSYKNQK
ncbi:MAG: ATP:cob(I)alamin adenosyltransferase [Bacteroidales bacterium]|nr:ATP:cob(I)alamin adenosyltransferase [Bacteroidales bacterium]MBR6424283.1 ATP:cob(I)alamin adenosyltransferase [Bacteroidales bacterium]